jgi:hypothetical protein
LGKIFKKNSISRENDIDCETWSLLLRQIGVKRTRVGIFGNRLYSELSSVVALRTDRHMSNY